MTAKLSTSPNPGRRPFIVGLLCGAVLTGGLFLGSYHWLWSRPYIYSKGNSESPADFLFEEESLSLSNFFYKEDAVFVLGGPESITVHRAAAKGIQIEGYTFETEGIRATPKDSESLVKTFRGINAYTPVSRCVFEPGVLVRLNRGGHHLDLLICFKCEDIGWVLDSQKQEFIPQYGLSDIGVGALLSVLRHVFPEDRAFRSK